MDSTGIMKAVVGDMLRIFFVGVVVGILLVFIAIRLLT
jgi:hypothetical protein